jgi:hypothetical protein
MSGRFPLSEIQTMKRIITVVSLMIFVVFSVAACGGASDVVGPPDGGVVVTPPPTPPVDPTGQYALNTYNGNALPYQIGQAGDVRKLISGGSVILRSDKTYITEVITRTEQPCCVASEMSTYEKGTYTFSGTTLMFHVSGQIIGYSGSLVDGVVAFTSNGVAFKFKR